MAVYTKEDLIHLKAEHPTLVGIDSDGCVFDTMGVKQRDFFHPRIIKLWHLEKIEPQLRAAAEFANLYSSWRGTNRFVALLETFKLLHDWPEVAATGVPLPETDALQAYVDSGLPLGNPTLEEEVARTGDPELKRLLDWSLGINEDIAENMQEIPPFAGVREALDLMAEQSDLVVVSQTPEEALVNEWNLHNLAGHVKVIAGQELGTKAEHLEMARGERYPATSVLMVGDAPGDQTSAQAVGAHFFPIVPGSEAASWKELRETGYPRFLAGTFAGGYQEELIRAFQACLPSTPPWLERDGAAD